MKVLFFTKTFLTSVLTSRIEYEQVNNNYLLRIYDGEITIKGETVDYPTETIFSNKQELLETHNRIKSILLECGWKIPNKTSIPIRLIRVLKYYKYYLGSILIFTPLLISFFVNEYIPIEFVIGSFISIYFVITILFIFVRDVLSHFDFVQRKKVEETELKNKIRKILSEIKFSPVKEEKVKRFYEEYLTKSEEERNKSKNISGKKSFVGGKRQENRRNKKEFWFGLSGLETENELNKIFEKLGFETELTPPNNDEGIDHVLNGNIVVQTKNTKKKVNRPDLQRFWGSWKDSHKKGIFVSIHGFTRTCEDFVKDKPILLYDVNDVIKMSEYKKPSWNDYKNNVIHL